MLDLRLAPLRLLWATLPLTLGPLLADALDPRAEDFRTTVALASWIIWAIVLVATLVPRGPTLTVVRFVVPATVPAAIWAALAVDDPDGVTVVLGIVAATAAAISALVAPVGEAFVDGSSYGDERRMPLRPTGVLLLGPIPLAWAVGVAGLTAGPLLLAAQRWVAGAVVTAVGVPLALAALRALHRLSTRWLVFVPAGFVVHDHLALAEPTLFPRIAITGLTIARPDTTATDLSVGALGMLVEARLDRPIPVIPARRKPSLDPVEITGFLMAPSRPGAALAEARKRRIPTGG